ncbi:MAG: 3-hydroxybutyryl-CoA dehydrogenase [Defluviicoccus sp.]|nr:3-hydroxybutyryl-CoA dehydrogenase [Defluviicoccus sp.]MDS4072966.1 3-hydroxybutyryl-CoA dehydrogenase [Defluviicoccus sp.]
MDINTVGVVGAGQMGTGIAQVCATAGLAVILLDAEPARLDQAMAALAASFNRAADRGRMTKDEAAAALARIHPVQEYARFSECQVAIEAVNEDEAAKRAVLKSLCAVLPPDAIISSNTSTISITRLAAQTDRPGRFLGMHFMNPVPKMGLVELIRGIATDEATFSTAHTFALLLGKTPISAEDFPAFVVHRILMPMINEAIYTLYEGVGSVESIDVAMRLGTHHPMGPLELADFIGLDTCLGIMHTLHEGLADSKYRPCPLLVKYVEAGWLGRKTGRGFYDYSGERPVPTR